MVHGWIKPQYLWCDMVENWGTRGSELWLLDWPICLPWTIWCTGFCSGTKRKWWQKRQFFLHTTLKIGTKFITPMKKKIKFFYHDNLVFPWVLSEDSKIGRTMGNWLIFVTSKVYTSHVDPSSLPHTCILMNVLCVFLTFFYNQCLKVTLSYSPTGIRNHSKLNRGSSLTILGCRRYPPSIFFFNNFIGKMLYFILKKGIIQSHRDLNSMSSSTDKTNLLVTIPQDFAVPILVSTNHQVHLSQVLEESLPPWGIISCIQPHTPDLSKGKVLTTHSSTRLSHCLRPCSDSTVNLSSFQTVSFESKHPTTDFLVRDSHHLPWFSSSRFRRSSSCNVGCTISMSLRLELVSLVSFHSCHALCKKNTSGKPDIHHDHDHYSSLIPTMSS
jgi:hypothetical protein